jgi:hypothetical protein
LSVAVSLCLCRFRRIRRLQFPADALNLGPDCPFARPHGFTGCAIVRCLAEHQAVTAAGF